MQKSIELKNTLIEIVIAVLPSLTDAVIKTLEKTIDHSHDNSQHPLQGTESDGSSQSPFFTGANMEVAASSDTENNTDNKPSCNATSRNENK